jgi:outer membrane protein OmpA-like peptidoglycan-associated protein
MSLRTIFLLIFTLLYFIVGHWLYTHKIIGICSGGEKTVAVVPTVEDPSDDDLSSSTIADATFGPLSFNWSDRTPIISDGFDKYQSDIVDQLEDDKDLEITGYYFSDEVIPDGFQNMGKARADELRKMFKDFIGEDRIIINSKLIDDIDGNESNPFEAAEFNWVTRSRVNDTTIREFDVNNIRINFPFNSSDKEDSKEMDDYLPELAEYLQETGKSVLIEGHTDSTGDPLYNYDLGLQRAIKIRNLLVKYGADRDKISVDSRGERYPIASNRTREGEHKNRRVEITLK